MSMDGNESAGRRVDCHEFTIGSTKFKGCQITSVGPFIGPAPPTARIDLNLWHRVHYSVVTPTLSAWYHPLTRCMKPRQPSVMIRTQIFGSKFSVEPRTCSKACATSGLADSTCATSTRKDKRCINCGECALCRWLRQKFDTCVKHMSAEPASQ